LTSALMGALMGDPLEPVLALWKQINF